MLYIAEPPLLAVTNQYYVREEQAALVNSPFVLSFWGASIQITGCFFGCSWPCEWLRAQQPDPAAP